MTTLTFKQTGTAIEDLQAGCSSLDLPDPIVTNHQAVVGGSGSATQHTRTVTGSDTGADSEVMLAGWTEFPAGVQGGETWEAGDWICRLQVTARNSAVQWTSVYICGKVGSDWTTIASKTDVNTLLASTGTKTTTLTTGSATDWSGAASSPYLYWFYGFEKSTSAEQTFKYKSNKNFATPIVAKVSAPVVTLAGTAASSALGFGVPSVALSGTAISPQVPFPIELGSPPRSRIASSGIEVGAGVATAVSAARYAGSAAAVGASSSSTLAASQFSWSGQRIGTIPYGALVAGRTISSTQRLLAIVGADPVSSRHSQSGAVQGVGGSCGVAAAAISSCGVEIGGLAYAD